MTNPLLSIQNVEAHYGALHALKGIDLDIQAGEMFAVLGPSGSGKSTLLRVIAGFEQASAGTITLGGTDLSRVPVNRREIGLMFQSYALFPHMSVADNIGYGLAAERLPRAEIAARVAEALDMIGLQSLARRRPAQLSGGQRQRVALARAIVKRPKLLLLDEPLSALDRQIRAGMQSELKRLQHETGMAFVIVTHDQEEAMSLADRVAVLHEGRVDQLGTPDELYERPATRFCAEFIGTSSILSGVVALGGVEVEGIGLVPASAASALPEGSAAIAVVRPEHMSLTEPESGDFHAQFESASYLGGAADVELAASGNRLVVRATAVPRIERNAVVGVRVDPAGPHVLAA